MASEKDLQGRRRIDASELARVYGELTPRDDEPMQSNESVRDSQVNTDDTPKIIALVEGQVQDLKEQLDTATAEKAQLLKLLSAEKEEKCALMPPADEKLKSRKRILRNNILKDILMEKQGTRIVFNALMQLLTGGRAPYTHNPMVC